MKRRPVCPVVSRGECRDRHDEPGDDGGRDSEPAQIGTWRAGGAIRPHQMRKLGCVRQDVHAHRAEPDDEARLVQTDDQSLLRPHEDDCDARAEQHGGRCDGQRCDHEPEQRVRRTTAQILRVAEVVARETPAGARELQEDRWQEHEPEEDVNRQPLADERDRRALGGEEDEEHEPVHARQTLVAVHAAAEASRETTSAVQADVLRRVDAGRESSDA